MSVIELNGDRLLDLEVSGGTVTFRWSSTTAPLARFPSSG